MCSWNFFVDSYETQTFVQYAKNVLMRLKNNLNIILTFVSLVIFRCWEMNVKPIPYRLINWPITASIIVSFAPKL